LGSEKIEVEGGSNMEQLMTKQDLAKHWQVTTKAIDNWINDGLLTPCKRVPGRVRFSPKYISELEGVPLEKHSPLEWRRLQRELEFWKSKAEELEKTFDKLDMVISEKRYLMQKEA
jgi:hypothetical protein